MKPSQSKIHGLQSQRRTTQQAGCSEMENLKTNEKSF